MSKVIIEDLKNGETREVSCPICASKDNFDYNHRSVKNRLEKEGKVSVSHLDVVTIECSCGNIMFHNSDKIQINETKDIVIKLT